MDKILQAIIEAGGRPLKVGGCVRDKLMCMPCKDVDVEVYGLSAADLKKVLVRFGKVSLVGQSFGVIKLNAGGEEFDFTLPRRDNKNGRGHKAFTVEVDHTMSPQEAAKRRDFTINAIGEDIDGNLVDPYNGRRDLENGILRATSEHFVEDPLRVLRGMQFAARFDMVVEESTADVCRVLAGEFDALPIERVWGEFEKLVTKGVLPSRGIQFLKDAGWLQLFPELADLDGVEQDPIWHPEGDVLVHTMHVADAAAMIAEREGVEGEDRAVLVLAALCHDMGKPETTQVSETSGRIIAPCHDKVGVPVAERFLKRIGAFPRIIERVLPLVAEHMVHLGGDMNFRSVRRLAMRMGKSSIKELLMVMEADHSGRPPLPARLPEAAESIRDLAAEVAVDLARPKPLVMGRHLIDMGLQPGPAFKPVLDQCFEAQLDGEFADIHGGLAYVKSLV